MKKTQAKSKHPAKAAKVSGKVKPAPTKVRRLGGASAATGRPPMKQASMPLISSANNSARLIATFLREMEEAQDPEHQRAQLALGRRALKALTLQDAGYSLAVEIAGEDGQLEISLEALALWLQEGVEADGERVPRWRTMPAGSFHHLQRKPHKRLHNGKTRTLVQNASEVRLKTAGEEWLWRELARSAFEDAETAKALHHLLGWHQGAALRFLQRFLAARHSSQDETRERLITTAAAIASGTPDRIAATSKEDRHRIAREYLPDTE